MTRRAHRVDDNQAEVVEALREIPGVTVHPTHMVGDGFPDLVIGHRGSTYLVELKNPEHPPSGRRLTPPERRWHEWWRGHVIVAHDWKEVAEEIGAIVAQPPQGGSE